MFSGRPAEVDGRVFERQVERSTLPVVVDVWAPWCAPCRAMAPAYEAATKQLEPNVRLIKLNSDAEPAASSGLGIRDVPSLLLFRDGKEAARISGAMSAGQIIHWVRSRLGE